jgi:hypothetical protein
LSNKIEELRLNASKYDILMVTETWFTPKSSRLIHGYTCYHQDRLDGRKGGGVCIYVRNSLKSKKIELTQHPPPTTHIEQVWCKIKVDGRQIICGCIYRPPAPDKKLNSEEREAIKQKELEIITHAINSACAQLKTKTGILRRKKAHRLLIGGDFNFPNIDWSWLRCNPDEMELAMVGSSSTNQLTGGEIKFVKLLSENKLVQHVNKATFQKVANNNKSVDGGKQESYLTNTLDLILTESVSSEPSKKLVCVRNRRAEERIREMKYDKPLGEVTQGHLQISWVYKFARKGVWGRLVMLFK